MAESCRKRPVQWKLGATHPPIGWSLAREKMRMKAHRNRGTARRSRAKDTALCHAKPDPFGSSQIRTSQCQRQSVLPHWGSTIRFRTTSNTFVAALVSGFHFLSSATAQTTAGSTATAAANCSEWCLEEPCNYWVDNALATCDELGHLSSCNCGVCDVCQNPPGMCVCVCVYAHPVIVRQAVARATTILN